MKGGIIGDIIGSRFEKNNCKSKDFELLVPECRFTDDTVLTIAVADTLLGTGTYEENLRKYALLYPFAGYGGTFRKWMSGLLTGPYNSWGNGSAMRVSPVGYAFHTEAETLAEAARSAEVTHNHPEGIKGAQAIALCVFMARQGQSKEQIREAVSERFGYDLDRRIDDIRDAYAFDVSCQGSVPEAILAFLEAADFEDTIRTAVSIGGDSDTIACMAGAIAEAYYGGVPAELEVAAFKRLPASFLDVVAAFENRFQAR